jgi:hypothetical protein
MTVPIHLKRGERLEFPLAPTHPLASAQSFRLATREELFKNPFYSRVMEYRTGVYHRQIVAQNPHATLSAAAREILVSQLASQVGPVGFYNFANITVESGATLSYHGNFHWVIAHNVTIHDGGQVYVYCDDPTIPATLVLTCDQLSGNP